jgi:hypothetical protein
MIKGEIRLILFPEASVRLLRARNALINTTRADLHQLGFEFGHNLGQLLGPKYVKPKTQILIFFTCIHIRFTSISGTVQKGFGSFFT